jgi:purine nucleoside phosphorylase
MRTAIITGSGTETWPALDGPVTRRVGTRYGQVVLTEGKAGGAEVLHLGRHEAGHRKTPASSAPTPSWPRARYAGLAATYPG